MTGDQVWAIRHLLHKVCRARRAFFILNEKALSRWPSCQGLRLEERSCCTFQRHGQRFVFAALRASRVEKLTGSLAGMVESLQGDGTARVLKNGPDRLWAECGPQKALSMYIIRFANPRAPAFLTQLRHVPGCPASAHSALAGRLLPSCLPSSVNGPVCRRHCDLN